jgi:SNF2 family DNA or RNA helicase
VSFKGQLYPFQAAAVERMIAARQLLLAMDMGLGKTVVSIAATEQLFDQGDIGGGFIICPASLKRQWRQMLEEFTGGDAKVILVEGDPRERLSYYSDYKAGRGEYLIFNPDLFLSDWQVISKLPRDFIIADEVTWAKGFKAKRSRRLKQLKATFQWGLTGQPVENRAEEVFSIMQWVKPDALGRWDIFDRAFIVRDHWGRVRTYRNLPTLHKLLSDNMIRHTRDEVADQLPAVTEQVVPVELDRAGAKLYRHIVSDLQHDIEEVMYTFGNFNVFAFYHGDDSGDARGRIMAKLLALRMLCDHPQLLANSAGRFRGAIRDGRRGGSEYAQELWEGGHLDGLDESPKLRATMEMLIDILGASPRNKVVLFSFFIDALDMLAAETATLTKSVMFTGRVSQRDRDAAKAQFAVDPETRLFLSSDAGGVGLDLPMANYLISYDLPWSAGAYAQRQARIIRLSSRFRTVTLISLQVEDSIEQYQHALLKQKAKVAAAVIDGQGIDARGRLKLDLQSLSGYLVDHTP